MNLAILFKNPKSEYRISKQIRDSNLKIRNFSVLKIRILIIRACFGFHLPAEQVLWQAGI
jgi:hypothetical protein